MMNSSQGHCSFAFFMDTSTTQTCAL